MTTTSAPKRVTGFYLIVDKRPMASRPSVESHSPARLDHVVGSFPTGTKEDVDAAVAAARKAYPAWRRTSRVYRADLFDNLAQLIKRETDNLATLMAYECGKIFNECRAE